MGKNNKNCKSKIFYFLVKVFLPTDTMVIEGVKASSFHQVAPTSDRKLKPEDPQRWGGNPSPPSRFNARLIWLVS